jgi:tetratricopeptide (TPR) repeat protein/tRNA A-37 threonylcarbamoyl transferase component Bud32
MNRQDSNDPPADDARLIDLAKQIDKRLEAGDDRIMTDSVGLAPAEIDEIQRAEQALAFLNRVRHNLEALDSRVEVTDESAGIAEDSTRVGRDGSPLPHALVGDEPESLGRFEIQSVLGQGGFARVFLARDPHLNRQVALKVPLPNSLNDEAARKRFEREAQAAAILSHPAIVPIFETGKVGPISYIAFGYCPGTNLSQWFADQQGDISPRVAAEIVAKIAEATEHAHQRGIVHRDLKPGNVLLEHSGTTDSEALAAQDIADHVRIADFGLARFEASQEETLTIEGAVVGTPAYMSPEQARGEANVGPASDIFSLGAMLYELLTGERPFKKETHLATLRAIENSEPVPLRDLQPTISKDLESICLKCLRKSASDRYGSAYELSADLQRWLDGIPVQARPATSLEKVAAWSKRNRALSIAMAVAFLAVVTGLAGTTWQWRQARQNLIRAEAAAAEEKIARVRSENVAKFLGQTYRSVDAERDGRDVKVVDMLSRAIDEVAVDFADDDESRWMLQRQLAGAYMNLGVIGDSLEILQPIREERAADGKLNDDESVQLLLDLATAHNHVGDQTSSLDLTEQAVDLATEIGVEDHLMALCLKGRADARANRGNRGAAIDDLRQALVFLESDATSTRSTIVNTKCRLGSILRAQGNYAEAEQMLQSSLDELESLHGPDHPHTLNARSEYANLLAAMDRTEETVSVRLALLESTERIRGPDHPKSLTAKSNLAATLSRIGRPAEAVPYFQDCIERSKKVFGDESPYTYIPIYLLGNAYRDLKKHELAKSRYFTAYTGLRETLGPLNNWTTRCSNSLNKSYEQAGDWQASADLHAQASADHAAAHGANNQNAVLHLTLSGTALILAGEIERGLTVIEESVRRFPADLDAAFVRIYARLLQALVETEQFAVAERYAEDYADLAKKESADAKDKFFSGVFSGFLFARKGESKLAKESLANLFVEHLEWPDLHPHEWRLLHKCLLGLAEMSQVETHDLHSLNAAIEEAVAAIPLP